MTSRAAGFARDLLTASILGANIYSDIFFVAFKLPNMFRQIFAEGAFTQAFLPSFTHARYKGAFCREIFVKMFGVVALISLFVTFSSELVTTAIAWGFDEAAIRVAAPFVALNFWYLDFIFVSIFLMSLLHYRKHFAAPAFSTALLNLAMIAALLLARDQDDRTIVFYLSWGVIAGGFLQVFTHLLAARGKRIFPMLIGGFRKKRDSAEDVKRFYKGFFPAIFGASGAQAAAFIDTLLATFLTAGSISYLYYANRIFQLPLAIFAIAVSMAIFPAIAKAIKRGDEAGALKILTAQFWVLLALLSFSALGGIMLSDGIIWLLFERGAFVRADTEATATALLMYLLGLVPYGLSRIFSLWLYSKNQQGVAAKNTAIALFCNVLFSLALIAPLGTAGLALSGSLAGVIMCALNMRSFGVLKVFAMIRVSYLALLAAALIAEAALIEIFKYFVNYRSLL
jgi:putative peptidoglycan lipid II flippase